MVARLGIGLVQQEVGAGLITAIGIGGVYAVYVCAGERGRAIGELRSLVASGKLHRVAVVVAHAHEVVAQERVHILQSHKSLRAPATPCACVFLQQCALGGYETQTVDGGRGAGERVLVGLAIDFVTWMVKGKSPAWGSASAVSVTVAEAL